MTQACGVPYRFDMESHNIAKLCAQGKTPPDGSGGALTASH